MNNRSKEVKNPIADDRCVVGHATMNAGEECTNCGFVATELRYQPGEQVVSGRTQHLILDIKLNKVVGRFHSQKFRNRKMALFNEPGIELVEGTMFVVPWVSGMGESKYIVSHGLVDGKPHFDLILERTYV